MLRISNPNSPSDAQLPTMPPKRERSESVASSTLADVELLMVETRAHHAFNKLMSNSPEGVAFLHGPRFSNAMKEAAIATNAAVTFNITADQAVEELRRFLALKVFLQDDKAEKLAPSSLVETMWQAAILDTQLHQELQAVLPFFVHHRPASDAEVEARKVRLVTMESVYYRFFGRNPLGKTPGLQLLSQTFSHITYKRQVSPEKTPFFLQINLLARNPAMFLALFPFLCDSVFLSMLLTAELLC